MKKVAKTSLFTSNKKQRKKQASIILTRLKYKKIKKETKEFSMQIKIQLNRK
jgi:hypothetical protein